MKLRWDESTMEKRTSILISFFSLMLIINGNIYLSETYANPLPIPLEYYMGGIFTNSTLPFNLTIADVVFDIDSTDFAHNIGISFEGNYTIFNPSNITEIMVIAPFSVSESVIASNCTVEVNNSQIMFDIGDPYEFGIEDWVSNYSMFYLWTYIVCNITIPENGSQTIKYKFNGLMPNSIYENDDVSIFYDLDTSKAWNGNITERVEFRVHGKLPDGYSEWTEGYYEERCIITDVEDGRNYTWEWNNEQINTKRVGITYKKNVLTQELIVIIIVSVGISVPIIIVLIVFVVRRRKRSQR